MKHLILIIIFISLTLDCYNQDIRNIESKLDQLADDPYTNYDSIIYYTKFLFKADSLNNLAIDYSQLALEAYHKTDEILHFLNDIIIIDPTNPDFYVRRGNLKLYSLNDTTGISDLREAYKLDSTASEILYNIGAYMFNIACQKYDSLFYTMGPDLINLSQSEKNRIEREKRFYQDEACRYLEKTVRIDLGSFYAIKYPLYVLYKRQGRFKKADSLNKIEYSIITDSLFNPLSPLQYYFPQKFLLDTVNRFIVYETDSVFFERMSFLADFKNMHYSWQLYTLEEPILFGRIDDKEIYRFTWIRTFDKPIAIRLEQDKEDQLIFVKVCDVMGGYNPGELIKNQKIRLTKNKWKKFIKKLDEYGFWTTPSIEKTDLIINDGAHWILEGKSNNNYHMVYRHSPTEHRGVEFRKLCLYLLKLSNLSIKEDDIY